MERFEEKVNRMGPIPDSRPDLGPCWIWNACLVTNGYGQFHHNKRRRPAHVVSYELHVGHPIAYYEGSWAGAMCPTDDVIAHLMLMRGDEPMFWRRANQHAPNRPEAGI